MSGKLVVLEGADGSGKATQAALLAEHLRADGVRVRQVTFPNYAGEASAPVRMYLAGRFGTNPEDVNPYVASTFYAVDRFASYREDWREFYEAGGVIIADRYVTSNMVHQMTKCATEAEARKFLAWLDDFEYEKFELPRPDRVCLLDIPLAVSAALLAARRELKDARAESRDIHERDREYLQRCYAAYDMLEANYGWIRIRCADGEVLRSPKAIHADVYAAVQSICK
ncbi:MAG: thymidylate kinase [Veillonellaceae bacterium]|nr:thymidylate kinase [Veillonellaceae bacterium]